MFQLNDIIKDDKGNEYTIISAIGNGGMGYVLEAERKSDGEKFAVKTLQFFIENDSDYKALCNEGKLATDIENENVIKYEFFHDGKTYEGLDPYIIMELADKENLQHLIDSQKSKNELFNQEELLGLFLQIINGMKAINEKLIHRDIKPANILLKDGKIKISDFGISKIAGDSTRSSTFKGFGTLPYYAPEVFAYKPNTIQMDIYSIGIVFYLLSTLQHPYTLDTSISDTSEQWKQAHMFQVQKPIIEINKILSPTISSVIQKMMEKKIDNRYSNWDDIIRDLQKLEELTKAESSDLIKDMLSANESQRSETARLNSEREEREKHAKEKRDTIIYQYESEVIKPLDDFITDLNKVVVQENEKIRKTPEVQSTNPYMYRAKDGKFRINVGIQIISERDFRVIETADVFGNRYTKKIKPEFKGKDVIAWGIIQDENTNKGMNLVLCKTDDIYGEWYVLENEESPISGRREGRPTPFAFDYGELPKEVSSVGAIHIYQTKYYSLDIGRVKEFFKVSYINS